jgi:hypothetical protein
MMHVYEYTTWSGQVRREARRAMVKHLVAVTDGRAATVQANDSIPRQLP